MCDLGLGEAKALVFGFKCGKPRGIQECLVVLKGNQEETIAIWGSPYFETSPTALLMCGSGAGGFLRRHPSSRSIHPSIQPHIH